MIPRSRIDSATQRLKAVLVREREADFTTFDALKVRTNPASPRKKAIKDDFGPRSRPHQPGQPER